MTNEEKYIREKMGTHNPFTVPDGYFEQLSRQIIDRLPDEVGTDSVSASTGSVSIGTGSKPKPAIVRYLRPVLYAAAACAVLAVAVGTFYRNPATADTEQLVAHQQETVTTYSDTYMEEMADYAMLDNEDIYASLLLADL